MANGKQQALFLETMPGPLIVKEIPIPKPAKGEVGIKVHSVALNPVDAYMARVFTWDFMKPFLQNSEEKEHPFVHGLDFAGEIVSLGEGVTNFKIGDRVFGGSDWPREETQAFQQYNVMLADLVGKLPGNVSYEAGSTFGCAGATAAIGLYPALKVPAPWDQGGREVGKGRSVLVLGGSTSVGQFAIQFCRLSGYSTIITTCSDVHTDYVKSLGATHVVPRSAIAQDVLTASPNGQVKFVFDAVGGLDTPGSNSPSVIGLAVDVLTSSGGGILSTVSPFSKIEDDAKAKGVELVTFYGILNPHNRAFGQKMYIALAEYFADGSFVGNRPEVLPGGLAGIDAGLERLFQKQVSGVKLVARPQET